MKKTIYHHWIPYYGLFKAMRDTLRDKPSELEGNFFGLRRNLFRFYHAFSMLFSLIVLAFIFHG